MKKSVMVLLFVFFAVSCATSALAGSGRGLVIRDKEICVPGNTMSMSGYETLSIRVDEVEKGDFDNISDISLVCKLQTRGTRSKIGAGRGTSASPVVKGVLDKGKKMVIFTRFAPGGDSINGDWVGKGSIHYKINGNPASTPDIPFRMFSTE